MKNQTASSKIVRNPADGEGNTNGGAAAGSAAESAKAFMGADLNAAIVAVRAEIGRLSKELENASEEDKPRLKAALEELMKAVCLEIEPPATAAASDTATGGEDQTNADKGASTESTTDTKKGVFGWIKENKVKTAAIVAAVAAVAVATVYAVRSGKADKLGDAANGLVQRATEAMNGMFANGEVAEAVAEATTASADAAAEAVTEPSIGNKIVGFGKAIVHRLSAVGSVIADTAVSCKDTVFGWFGAGVAVTGDEVAMAMAV